MLKKLFTISIILLNEVTICNGQIPTLEMTSGAGNPQASGSQSTTIIFQKNLANPTNNLFSGHIPAITATYTLSNQQFTSIEGNANTPGSEIGKNASTNNTPVAYPVFPLMNGGGAATDPRSLNSHYSSTASELTKGIDIAVNRAVAIINYTDALISSTGASTYPLDARIRYADLTISFNVPVTNPILHFTCIGGAVDYSTAIGPLALPPIYRQGMSTEFDLLSTNVTLSKLSGSSNFSIINGTIKNTSTRFGANTDGSTPTGISAYAASGSILVNGENISSVTFRMYLKGDGGIVHDNSGNAIAATNSNTVRWAIPQGFVMGGSTTSISRATGDLLYIGVSLRLPVSVSGNVFHDPNAGNVNNSTSELNTIPPGIYAYLIKDGVIIASTQVASDGTYSFANVAPGVGYSVVLSTIFTNSQTPPAITLPANWLLTGDFNGEPNTGNINNDGVSSPFNVTTTDVTNVNFGIQQGPETAVNQQPIQNNPGGVISVTVPQDAFQTSNVGMNPNTDDPNTGTVTQINIPAFPTNATSITIGTTIYTSGTWPIGGVTITYTDGVGPNETIKVDPIDGAVSVVIPIISIDNAGVKDPSAGSVTLPFDAALPITLQSFTAKLIDKAIHLVWKTANESNFSHFEVEKSINSKEFGSVKKVIGNKASIYKSIDTEPTEGNNYYRLKMVDNDGSFKKSNIISVNFVNNAEFIAVENPANNGRFKVYTNLAEAIFKLVNTLGSEIEIKTIKLNNNQFNIEPRNANSGIYYLIINSKGKVTSKKVLIPE